MDEIDSYTQLIQAEKGQLRLKLMEFGTLELLERIKNQYMGHEEAKGKVIELDSRCEDVIMLSDAVILSRILGNMIKNALEAIKDGEIVTLSCVKNGEKVRISVQNPGVIPREVQLQIFQRSFSTKGTGRGLGTYSIKLLSEEFLKGKAGFTSSGPEGTTFFVDYPVSLEQ
ncbi:MAG: HAMP domain-containing sensor histidine kinase [Bacteroidales bacterium]|nr:HAMP domain-containing sensor histidine kinase [Bacteroidales bacterium]